MGVLEKRALIFGASHIGGFQNQGPPFGSPITKIIVCIGVYTMLGPLIFRKLPNRDLEPGPV